MSDPNETPEDERTAEQHREVHGQLKAAGNGASTMYALKHGEAMLPGTMGDHAAAMAQVVTVEAPVVTVEAIASALATRAEVRTPDEHRAVIAQLQAQNPLHAADYLLRFAGAIYPHHPKR